MHPSSTDSIPTTSAGAPRLPPRPTTPDDLSTLTAEQWQAVLGADPVEAAAWLAAASHLGHAGAQTILGQWHLDAHGVSRDPVQALGLFLRAAQLGDPMAMNMAGRSHEQGWGTPLDPAKAAHWYRQAAQTGLPEAQYNLANMLADGQGVARDLPQAFDLYTQAAAQNFVKAYAKLGLFHEDGLVVPRNADVAFDWYRRGAEGGDFRGQFGYAGMLAARGRRDEALHWLALVPDTATERYLRQAGELLAASPDADFRAIGLRMLQTSR